MRGLPVGDQRAPGEDRHMAVIPPNLNRRSIDGLNHTTTGLSPDRLGEGLHSLAFVHAHAV